MSRVMNMKKVLFSIMLIAITISGTVFGAERTNLSFIYGVSNPAKLVDRTNGSVNEVAPTYFDIDNSGNLQVSPSFSESFITQMHERGITVTPFLSNHWNRKKGRAALANTEELTNQIAEVIRNYELDGVNVDIENVTAEDKDAYTEFVRVLREKIPEEKKVTVSVAANPQGLTGGWQGSYDYAKLAEYSDYLMIMSYDEHAQGGAAGPVASIGFVEKSIQYALEQGVSKDKILIGIPFYGRFWKVDADVGGEAIVIGQVPNLVAQYGGTIEYVKEYETAKATITISEEAPKPKVNGKELEAGTYVIWYENEESIRAKLSLVNQYDLLGTGNWALGNESSSMWKYYKEALNEVPYEPEEVIDEAEVIRINQIWEQLQIKYIEENKPKAPKMVEVDEVNILGDKIQINFKQEERILENRQAEKVLERTDLIEELANQKRGVEFLVEIGSSESGNKHKRILNRKIVRISGKYSLIRSQQVIYEQD